MHWKVDIERILEKKLEKCSMNAISIQRKKSFAKAFNLMETRQY